MTCALSLLVFGGGSQFLAVATVAAGGTPSSAALCSTRATSPTAWRSRRCCAAPCGSRALSSQVVLDESTFRT
jgi:hypothetical protein